MEHNQILEASRQEIMDLGNAEHNRILSEKDKEMQELKKKYSELRNNTMKHMKTFHTMLKEKQ